MTKARTIADLGTGFVNISDTGTEGTKVASGTTAQRGSTTGQWRYNTDTGFFEGRNTNGSFSTLEPTPTIISTNVSEVDSQAGGNVTIRVTGTNFATGGTIKFIGNDATEITASTSTFVNTSNYDAVIAKSSFVNSKEPYDVKYISSSGLTAQLDDQINVDTAPAWNTASGSLGSVNEGASGSFTVSATDADSDTIVYSLQSGSLGGLSLDSSTGVISGTASTVSSATTNSFTIRATANSKTSDRAFSFITNNSTVGTFDVFGDSSALSLHQLNNSYNQTGSGTGNLGYSGVSFSTTSKFGSHSVDLRGDGDYLDITSTTRIYAISSWLYIPSGTTGQGDDEYFYEFRHDNPANGRAYLYLMQPTVSGKEMRIDLTNDSTATNNCGDIYINGTKITSGQFNFNADEWYHIVCSVNNASSTHQTWNEGVRFGSRSDGSTGGNTGLIDQIRTFNRALSSSEVTTLYNEF